MQKYISLPKLSPRPIQSYKIGLAILNLITIYKLPQPQSQLQSISLIINEFQKSIKDPDVKKGSQKNEFPFTCGKLVEILQHVHSWSIDKMIMNKNKKFRNSQQKIPLTKIAHIKFPRLKTIVLRYVSDQKIPVFDHAAKMKQLEEIDIKDGELEDIGNLYVFDGLRRISLNNNKVNTIEGLEKMNMSDLKILSIASNNLKGLIQLANLTTPKLQILDLHKNKIIGLIVGPSPTTNSLSHLKILNLCQNQIQSIESLGCADTSSLELLNLSNNKITNIRVLGRINFGSIKEINLSGNFISEYGALSHFSKDPEIEANLFITSRMLPKHVLPKSPPNTLTSWKKSSQKTLDQTVLGLPVPLSSSDAAFLNKINSKQPSKQLLSDISDY